MVDRPVRKTAKTASMAKSTESKSDMSELVGVAAEQNVNIAALAASIEKLGDQIHETPTKRGNAALVIFSNMFTVIVVIILFVTLLHNQTQFKNLSAQNHILALSNRATLETINDCLDTTTDDGDAVGKCAKESQVRLAGLIARVSLSLDCSTQRTIINTVNKKFPNTSGKPIKPDAKCAKVP